MKKLTQTQQQQERHKQVQNIICDALGWPSDNYHNMVYKHGCQYLQKRYCRHPILVDAAVLSPLFWAYWRNEWAHRDECFIRSFHIEQLPVERIWWLYKQVHLVQALFDEIKILPSVVQNEILQLSKTARYE